jgi:hypothetical protein
LFTSGREEDFPMMFRVQIGRVDSRQLRVETLATGMAEPVVNWGKSFRGKGPKNRRAFFAVVADLTQSTRAVAAAALLLLLLTSSAVSFPGRKKKDTSPYGEGLIVNVPLPEPEVEQAVEEVTENTIIRGTKEYNKDEYISGAVAATSTPVFAAWKEGGKVFYKVRTGALDPRNFKDGGDVGTLAVRYVVQPQGDKNTVLRIDALFVEDFRRTVHTSNGSVESSEYKDIQDKLAAVELIKQETAEALRAKQEQLAKEKFGLGSDKAVLRVPSSSTTATSASASGAGTDAQSAKTQSTPAQTATSESSSRLAAPATTTEPGWTPFPSSPPPASNSTMAQPATTYEHAGETLEQHVAELRHEVERLVKKPGAPLKSAPFHTASTLKSLDPGAEVLILIATPYWYGVETHDGDHGWMRRDQLEQVP